MVLLPSLSLSQPWIVLSGIASQINYLHPALSLGICFWGKPNKTMSSTMRPPYLWGEPHCMMTDARTSARLDTSTDPKQILIRPPMRFPSHCVKVIWSHRFKAQESILPSFLLWLCHSFALVLVTFGDYREPQLEKVLYFDFFLVALIPLNL